MSDFHPCAKCVWTDIDCEVCNNPLSDVYNIDYMESRCNYYLDEYDLREIYTELGVC
jgi:hypothetical protein